MRVAVMEPQAMNLLVPKIYPSHAHPSLIRSEDPPQGKINPRSRSERLFPKDRPTPDNIWRSAQVREADWLNDSLRAVVRAGENQPSTPAVSPAARNRMQC